MNKSIFCFFIILLTTSNTIALSQQFQNIGPPGGPVNKIVIDPENTNIVYAIPDGGGGLFKSVDGGITSEVMGDTLSGILGLNILINPINSNIIYSSGYKSSDKGMTWEKMNVAPGLINPKNPNQMFTWRYPAQLCVSNDGGETMEFIYNFKVSIGSMAISYSDTNILYVEAYDSVSGYGVHKSTNSGKNFTKTKLRSDNIIRDIEINPLNSNVVFVGTFEGNVYKTADGGNTWLLILQRPEEIVNDIAICSQDTNLVYIATHHWLWGNPGNVFKTTDAGLTWNAYNNGLPADFNRMISAISINPQNKDEVYAGTYGFGVYKTTNGGLNWEWTRLMTTGVANIYVDPDSSGHLYCATGHMGVVMTKNEGKTWEVLDFGIPTTTFGFSKFIFDPHNKNTAWALSGKYGLLKSTDRGNTWMQTSMTGNDATYIAEIVVHPKDSNVIYVGQTGWTSRNLYRSTNRGVTWTNLQLGSDYVTAIKQVKFDPNNSNIIYICTYPYGIFKSTDNGSTWFTINNGLIYYSDSLLHDVTAIVIRNDSTNILYTLQRGRIFKSTNGGNNWHIMDTTFMTFDNNLVPTGIEISPLNPKKVFVGSTSIARIGSSSSSYSSLYYTTNDGKNWERINGLIEGNIGNIVFDIHNPNKMYITSSYGILIYYDTLTNVADNPLHLPAEYILSQNYPNPFNSSTIIKYKIPNKSKVIIKIYDLLGRVVQSYYMEHSSPGEYQITWNGTNEKGGGLSSGVYFYRIEADGFVKTRKLLLMR